MINFQFNLASTRTLGAGIAIVSGLSTTTDDIPLDRKISEELVRPYIEEITLETANPLNTSTKISSEVEFLKRMRLFKDLASEDGIILADYSIKDAMDFMSSLISNSRSYDFVPYVSAYDNGNLRLLWKKDGEQIGLHFLGNREVQYVILTRDKATEKRTSQIGRISLIKAIELIKLHNAQHLVYA